MQNTKQLQVGDRIHISWGREISSQRVLTVSRVTKTLAIAKAEDTEHEWRFKIEAGSHWGNTPMRAFLQGERYSSSTSYYLETPEFLATAEANKSRLELETFLKENLPSDFRGRGLSVEFLQDLKSVIEKHRKP